MKSSTKKLLMYGGLAAGAYYLAKKKGLLAGLGSNPDPYPTYGPQTEEPITIGPSPTYTAPGSSTPDAVGNEPGGPGYVAEQALAQGTANYQGTGVTPAQEAAYQAAQKQYPQGQPYPGASSGGSSATTKSTGSSWGDTFKSFLTPAAPKAPIGALSAPTQVAGVWTVTTAQGVMTWNGVAWVKKATSNTTTYVLIGAAVLGLGALALFATKKGK